MRRAGSSLKKRGSPTKLSDKRAALDMLQVKQIVRRLGVAVRWAPGALQLSDVLTKDLSTAADTWRAHVERGRYHLADEASALAMRAAAKARRLARGQTRQEGSEQQQQQGPISGNGQ